MLRWNWSRLLSPGGSPDRFLVLCPVPPQSSVLHFENQKDSQDKDSNVALLHCCPHSRHGSYLLTTLPAPRSVMSHRQCTLYTLYFPSFWSLLFGAWCFFRVWWKAKTSMEIWNCEKDGKDTELKLVMIRNIKERSKTGYSMNDIMKTLVTYVNVNQCGKPPRGRQRL